MSDDLKAGRAAIELLFPVATGSTDGRLVQTVRGMRKHAGVTTEMTAFTVPTKTIDSITIRHSTTSASFPTSGNYTIEFFAYDSGGDLLFSTKDVDVPRVEPASDEPV